MSENIFLDFIRQAIPAIDKRADTSYATQDLVMQQGLTTDHTMSLNPTTQSIDLSSITTVSSFSTSSSTSHGTGYPTYTTETPNDGTVTIYTHLNTKGSITPSFQLIIPTITTNTLPAGYLPITSSNSSVSLSLPPSSRVVSNISQVTLSQLYSTLSSSSLAPTTYIDSDLLAFQTKTKSSHSRKSATVTLPTSSISQFPPPYQSSLSLPSSLSSPSTFSTKLTTTITQYLEDITYTQVYVVTDSKTTITTSLLATTTLYVDSLSSTYSISPPAITTDINALKSRLDFSSLFKKKLSSGAIAGIAIGSILGFFFLLGFFFFFFFLRGNKKNSKNVIWKYLVHGSKKYTSDDEGDYNEDMELHNSYRVYDRSNDTEEFDKNISRKRNTSIDLHTPPIPNRDNKPNLLDITPPAISNIKIKIDGSEGLDEKERENNNYDDLDLSLFDMKSALNAINASSETHHHLLPPIPPTRKSKGRNAIDKMNYTVDPNKLSLPTTPINKLTINDRAMGVLYESPNEQCIWDEFESAKNLGIMNNISPYDNFNIDSPIYSPMDSPLKESDTDYKPHYLEQLSNTGDYTDQIFNEPFNKSKNNNNNTNIFGSSRNSSNRVRSGSGATRYEYLTNNVSSFKHELEKERLFSPLRTTFAINDDLYDFSNDEAKITKAAPPVPKPRKNFNHN